MLLYRLYKVIFHDGIQFLAYPHIHTPNNVYGMHTMVCRHCRASRAYIRKKNMTKIARNTKCLSEFQLK